MNEPDKTVVVAAQPVSAPDPIKPPPPEPPPPLPAPEDTPIPPDGVENLYPDADGKIPDPRPQLRHSCKRTMEQREEDLERIAHWMIKGGVSQYEMARRINALRHGLYQIGRTQIAYDVKEVKGRLRKDYALELETARALELAKLEALEVEVWTAWEASKKPAETTKKEFEAPANPGDQPTQTKLVVEKKEREGEPAFAALLLRIGERRARLQGTEAASKMETTVNAKVEQVLTVDNLRTQYAKVLAVRTNMPVEKILAAMPGGDRKLLGNGGGTPAN